MLFVILLAAMLPTLIVGWLGYTTIYNNSKADKMHDVGMVADIRQYQLTFTLNGASSRAAQFLEINLNRCNALFGRSTTQTESCLRSALTIFAGREKAAGATLHRPKADDLVVGTLTAGSPGSWKLQPGQLAVFPPAQNQSDRVYHVPVTDPQTQSQLVMTYPVSLMQDIFVPQSALGHSGETFLADSNGLFITKPRYKSVQGHSMAISAVPMQTCLQQKNMEMLELDYRAAPIIHGFRYTPEIGGGCIMAHFDQQEAFAPLEVLKRKLIAIALAFGLLAGMLAFYLTRQITKPLNNLGRTVGSIVDGSEKIEISERGPIEVVSLAHSFNLMLKRLSQVIGKLNLSMSELKQANIKLEKMSDHLMQSEKMLNEAQQLAHLGGWERDLATGSITCSEEIFRIFEIDLAHTDISYEEFILAVHPEDRETVDQAYLTCIQTREPFDIVHRLLFADGRVKWVNEHGTFFYGSNDVPLRSIGAIQDITERKHAEDMLRVAATAFETHEGITITDAHANIIRVNQAFQDITGYSQEEVLGKSTRILSSGRQDKAFYVEMWQQLSDNGSWTGELWNKRKNGQIYPEWLTISAVKNEQGETTEYVGIFSDITERKRMEEDMRRSEMKFRTLYESSGDAVMLLDEKGFFDCNVATLRVFDCPTRDDFINKHPSQFSPPTQPGGQDSISLANEHIATAFKNGSDRFEWIHRRLDGAEFPAEVWLVSMELDGRQVLQATVRDITERKQLEDTRARFVAIMEETSDLVAMADLTGHLIYINRAGRKLLEIDESADISKTEIADYHPKWAAEIVLREGLQTAATCGTWSGETALLTKSGREFAVLQVIMAHRRQGDGVEYYSTVIHDISKRKEVENELCKYVEELRTINQQLNDTQNLLLQSDKMASVGQLAAGVAHEINNPIGYVGSNLCSLDGYLKDLFEVVAAYEEIENTVADSAALARVKAVKNKVDLDFLKEDVLSLMSESQEGIIRVKKIVQDLKDFSRVDSGDEWHRADLHKGLDSTLNVASNEIKYKADVKKEYGDIPEVECLLSQLNQVFMNLLVNAAHAIEERGTITLRTGQQGDEVWVEVTDTGKGIAPEHINKIFDPFFTTKPVGKGPGLRLSLSFGIIQKHHGRIEVSSEVGKGASFKVWLPVNQPQDGNTGCRVSVA
ncbi:MAG: PAS domain S-box protein [Gallionella sp.]|nr:PAS domain S-box protein [Gallionella sp.]